MTKKIVWILAVALLLTALCGCGRKKDIEPASFVEEVLGGAGFKDNLSRIDDAVVPILYEIDPGDYTEAIVCCGTAATGEEVAVFTAKDDAAGERLLSAARSRVDHLIESYKNYGPEAARSLENSVVARKGVHVIVVVCSDSEGAKKICDKYI